MEQSSGVFRQFPALGRAQPGLMFMPKYGVFLTIRLADTGGGAREAVWGAIQAASAAARKMSSGGEQSALVIGFEPSLWQIWTGGTPPGMPDGGTVLKRSPHLRQTNCDAHLWVFLKSDAASGCAGLQAVLEEMLGGLIADMEITEARQRRDGKVLDHHYSDGVTSPSDPIGVAGPIVISEAGEDAGGTWAFTQKFRVDWDRYGPQSIDAKEDVIGRNVGGTIIPDDDPHSHIRRARVFDHNQDNIKLLRQAMPYGLAGGARAREEGIYFASFASSTGAVETILTNMVGHGDTVAPDKLMNVVEPVAGGYWYVPPGAALGLGPGLTGHDFTVPPFWKLRSANGYMFYNGNDYINAMSTGGYAPGDAPSARILALTANAFSRWRDNWYQLRDIPRIPHLKHYLGPDEQHILDASVTVRKGVAIRKTLGTVLTHADPSYPLDPESHAWKGDTFRLHPQDLLFGVMPELSLARGKEVMPYLKDGDERTESLTLGIDEGGMVGHVVPDHFAILTRGIGPYIVELEGLRDTAEGEKVEFYQSVIHALQGVQDWCRNYAALADAMIVDGGLSGDEVANLQALAARARKLSTDRAETFAEAVQTVFMMHCCLHLIGNPVAVGRLDQYLGSFYEADDIGEAEAQDLIDAFWVKLDEKAIHNRHHITDHLGYGMTAVPYSGGNFPQGSAINQWIQQVTVGGKTRDGDEASNAVTMMCLRAARRLPFNAPCLSLRVTAEMPDAVVEEAAKALLSGGAHPILFQDDRLTKGLHEFSGFPIEDARDFACDGCYEPMINGKTEFAFGSIAPLDSLEMAINQGATIMGSGIIHLRGLKQGQRTQHPADIESFEEILDLMQQHMHWLVVRLFNSILVNYGNIGKVSPCPMLSSMMDGCIERGVDMYSGGARYHLIAPMFVGMATCIDSLYAIKKLVFDDETAVTTLPELLDCLRSDWGHALGEPYESTLAGQSRAEVKGKWYREMRQMALDLPKFGTGDAEVDEIGAWLADMVTTTAKDVMDNPPAPFAKTLQAIRDTYDAEIHMAPGVGTFEEYVGAGQNSAASADGRRFMQPYPSDMSPTPVPQDLAAIPQAEDAEQPRPYSYREIYRAMASWDDPRIYERFSNASPVDLNIREDFPEEELVRFIKRYAAGEGVGSNLITVTCADPDTYTAAETEPERYELVRVRMGGWTEFFAAMFPAHQEQHKRRPWFTPPAAD
ncbi:MAG: Dyp-type peroxidase [Rhodobacter sp.]|nr:Dyp-type peroxidase [Rhodobacter sp.]